MRVLVCDDDVVIPMMLGMERADLDLLEASSVHEAFKMAQHDEPDALIVDLRLPDGDGLGLVRKLRRRAATRQLPVIVLTAAHDPADEAKVLQAGADVYLAKPVEPRLLVAYLQAVIDVPPADRRARRHDSVERLIQGQPVAPLIDLNAIADEPSGSDPEAKRHWWRRSP
jgi:DNA-binding response OmpR family regulator